MPKLPMYVFKRANGSYRYKRNVPKDLREVIAKATVYLQLGNTYGEAMRNLPKVHAEIEALFDVERHTPDSQRALQVIKERLGAWYLVLVFAWSFLQSTMPCHSANQTLAREINTS